MLVLPLLLYVLLCWFLVQGMHDPMFPNLIPPGAASPSQEGSYSSRGYAVKFSGHRDTPTSSNVAWMGNSSQYVVSGSNDGSLFVWDSHTGEVVNIVRGGGKAIQRVQVRLAGGA
jgi:WD40 repeat protein